MSRKLRTAAALTALALAVLAAGGVGAAVKTTAGSVEAEFDGGFSPRALPKQGTAAIALSLWGKFRTLDRLHPLPLRELRIRSDRHVDFDLDGRPVCELPVSQGSRLTIREVRRLCRPAIVGSGRIKVGVWLVGDQTIYDESELFVVNGGVKGSRPTLYAYAEPTIPVPAAVVITVEVKKIRKGRFGTETIATIPKIAGGSGSITSFRLELKRGVLRATCPDGHLDARPLAVFKEGPRVPAHISKRCAQRG